MIETVAVGIFVCFLGRSLVSRRRHRGSSTRESGGLTARPPLSVDVLRASPLVSMGRFTGLTGGGQPTVEGVPACSCVFVFGTGCGVHELPLQCPVAVRQKPRCGRLRWGAGGRPRRWLLASMVDCSWRCFQGASYILFCLVFVFVPCRPFVLRLIRK